MAQVVAVVAVHGGENDEDNGGALNEGGGNIYFIPRFTRALRCNYSTEWTNATTCSHEPKYSMSESSSTTVIIPVPFELLSLADTRAAVSPRSDNFCLIFLECQIKTLF